VFPKMEGESLKCLQYMHSLCLPHQGHYGKESNRELFPKVLQLFAKTLATALVEKNNLRDHEK